MKCAICGITVESVDDAIDQEWIPLFFEGENEHGPACSSCAEKLICIGDDGEFELESVYQGKIVFQDEFWIHDDMDEDFFTDNLILGFILN